MIAEALLNPYNVDPILDLAHAPTGEPNWTEYHYQFAYDREQEIGISLHIGRLASDLGIWRGILYVFLPNEEVLVRKYTGRNGHARGFGAGPLVGTCIEPMKLWMLEFDGAVQSATRESLTRGPVRDGIDEPLSFNVLFEAAAPMSILDVKLMKTMKYAHHHFEQIHTIRGQLTYRGKTVHLNGVGARDHSSGPRDSRHAVGSFWANILFPSGKAINVNCVRTKDLLVDTGYVFWGDGTALEEIHATSRPDMNDSDTPPNSVDADIMKQERSFTLVINTSRGEEVIDMERVHSVASTYISPSHEVAGTDLDRPADGQQTKSVAVCRCKGEIGTAIMDRFLRISTLKR